MDRVTVRTVFRPHADVEMPALEAEQLRAQGLLHEPGSEPEPEPPPAAADDLEPDPEPDDDTGD